MRGLKWLAKLAISAVVTASCCVAFTFMTVNTYVDMILEQFHIERPASAKIEWAPFLSRFADSLVPPAGIAPAASGGAAGLSGSETGKDRAVAASGTPQSTETGSGKSKNDPADRPQTGQTDPYRVPEDAVAVWSRQPSQNATPNTPSPSDEDRRVVVSSEDFTKKKEQLSEQAKGKIFSMLVSRVPQEDMQKLSLLMEDGLTASEMKEAEEILQKHLKPEEYRDLLAILGTP
ncbi:hypothetical protein WMW72_13775 [Paenibacillus filicis]|uniref:Uncharacterized protein n=1 Tax=Paenibacillus filicis TaxID=669464 RepID=A0ABU9DMK0_9BACL